MISFRDGSKNEVNRNGETHTLKNPIVNIAYSNYISVADLVEIFGKHIVEKDGVVVISDYENLFIDDMDDGLLRYLKEQITIY